MFYKGIALLLSVLFVASPVAAQSGRVVDAEKLQELIDQHLEAERQNREAIREALQREEVREVASRVGLDLERADAIVATLDGVELSRLADQAREINNELAGAQASGRMMQGSMWIWGAIAVFAIALVVILLVSK